jgi:uncharacterized protein YceH (UPF0502 family)
MDVIHCRFRTENDGSLELQEAYDRLVLQVEENQRKLKVKMHELGILVPPPVEEAGTRQSASSAAASAVYNAETDPRLREMKKKVAALKAKIRNLKAEKGREEDKAVKREGS